MSNDTIAETTEATAAASANAWSINMKALVEEVLRDNTREREQVNTEGSQRRRDADREREELNDWHSFALEQARNNAQLTNRLAQDAATLSTRISNDAATISAQLASSATTVSSRLASNAATLDNMVSADAMTSNQAAQTADNAMMSKVADSVKGAVTSAMDAAVAAAVQSNPVNAGSTGVAAGSMQLSEAATTNAMMNNMGAAIASIASSMVELNKAMAVLILKTTGEVVVAKA